MSNFEYPAYPILALIAAVLVLIPMPWHLQAWNSGTCLFMVWTAIGCLNLGVNAIVWNADAIDRAPIWCDISSHIIVAVAVAIPASSLCINRRLYKIASVRAVRISKAEKRRAVLVDLAIGLGIPVAQLLFEYIVSGHRYDIYEQVGCYPYVYPTPLMFPFVLVWPIIIGLCSAVYCLLSLRAFAIRRAQFNQFLAASSSLTMGRYFRLMALAAVELLCTTPLAGYGLYLNASGPIAPWISFADTHFDYGRVQLFPAVVWKMSNTAVISFQLSRWSVVLCGLLFFMFFGFADEARRNYRKIIDPVAALIRRRFGSAKSTHESLKSGDKSALQTASVGSLPVYYPSATTFAIPVEKSDRPPQLHLDLEAAASDLSPPPTAHSPTWSFRTSSSWHGHAV
ncbi:Pheromone B alpha 3 receptor [Trametes pubescens]|uniref:Pheromone B alpha 3 receptor n=1 Tax=Trametes pubescens TaxID=154538 RepID=A0A1M2W3U2_TRAPU|nr:Pheromone B alpha 3 receptor [Trametes pubescens]